MAAEHTSICEVSPDEEFPLDDLPLLKIAEFLPINDALNLRLCCQSFAALLLRPLFLPRYRKFLDQYADGIPCAEPPAHLSAALASLSCDDSPPPLVNSKVIKVPQAAIQEALSRRTEGVNLASMVLHPDQAPESDSAHAAPPPAAKPPIPERKEGCTAATGITSSTAGRTGHPTSPATDATAPPTALTDSTASTPSDLLLSGTAKAATTAATTAATVTLAGAKTAGRVVGAAASSLYYGPPGIASRTCGRIGAFVAGRSLRAGTMTPLCAIQAAAMVASRVLAPQYARPVSVIVRGTVSTSDALVTAAACVGERVGWCIGSVIDRVLVPVVWDGVGFVGTCVVTAVCAVGRGACTAAQAVVMGVVRGSVAMGGAVVGAMYSRRALAVEGGGGAAEQVGPRYSFKVVRVGGQGNRRGGGGKDARGRRRGAGDDGDGDGVGVEMEGFGGGVGLRRRHGRRGKAGGDRGGDDDREDERDADGGGDELGDASEFLLVCEPEPGVGEGEDQTAGGAVGDTSTTSGDAVA